MKRIPFIIVLFLYSKLLAGQGSVFKGGDISLKRIAPFTVYHYSVSVRLAINWPIAISKPYLKISWGDGTPVDSIAYGGSNCTGYGASTLLYAPRTHTYAGPGNYQFYVLDSFMVANISNIPNSSTQKLFLRSMIVINNTTGANSSPTSLGCLTDSSCCYNPGMADLDGDSLSYSIVSPLAIANYSIPPANINSTTGTLTFTTYIPGLTHVSLKVEEWRKNLSNMYTIIGITYQELLFKMPPTVGISEQTTPDRIRIFPNPVSDVLVISSGQNKLIDAEIEIINMLGQIVSKIDYSNRVDVSNIPSGTYILKVTTIDNRKVYSKFIKE